MKCICPTDFDKQRDSFHVIDVREPYEYAVANLGFPNVPMAEVCEHVKQLTLNQPLLLICKSGGRAAAVANFLETELQMNDVCILDGGMQNWVETIDHSLILDI